jgi:hypothetical protein
MMASKDPRHSRNNSASYFGKSSYGYFMPEYVDTKRVIQPEVSRPSTASKGSEVGHSTKKMFHTPTTSAQRILSNLSSICKSTVRRDGFCDNIKPDQYTYMKKRRASYEKNVRMREYGNRKPRRVLQENSFKEYDRKSQIKCLPGSDYRETPNSIDSNKFHFGRTSDIYMQQHVFKSKVFPSQTNIRVENRENLKSRDPKKPSLTKLLATTPELEDLGFWKAKSKFF